MTRTATILAEMRAEHAEALSAHSTRLAIRADAAASKRILPSPLRERTTVRLSASQNAAKAILIKGLNDGNGQGWNVAKLAASVAKRSNGQMTYAHAHGKPVPDMLESLMAFFTSPGQLAHHVLMASTQPANVPGSLVKAVLTDPFVVDVIEGLGHQVPTIKAGTALVSHGTRGRGVGRGRPRKIATSYDAETCQKGGRGHSRTYRSEALPIGRGVPGNGAPTLECERYLNHR